MLAYRTCTASQTFIEDDLSEKGSVPTWPKAPQAENLTTSRAKLGFAKQKVAPCKAAKQLHAIRLHKSSPTRRASRSSERRANRQDVTASALAIPLPQPLHLLGQPGGHVEVGPEHKVLTTCEIPSA